MFNFKTLAFLFTNLEVQSPMQDPQHPVQKYSFIKFHETIKKKKRKQETLLSVTSACFPWRQKEKKPLYDKDDSYSFA